MGDRLTLFDKGRVGPMHTLVSLGRPGVSHKPLALNSELQDRPIANLISGLVEKAQEIWPAEANPSLHHACSLTLVFQFAPADDATGRGECQVANPAVSAAANKGSLHRACSLASFSKR